MRPWLLLVVLTGFALFACVPTPVGRATQSPDVSVDGSSATPERTAPDPTSASMGPSASPSFIRPTPLPSPTFQVYEVRAGDTLTSIARDFGTTARSLAYWNRSQYPSLDPDSEAYQPGLIKVGWLLLVIPTAVVDEDELPDPTPTPVSSTSASAGPS